MNDSSPKPPAGDVGGVPEPMHVGAGIDFADPGSGLAFCYLRASHVAAVGLLAAAFVLLCYVPLWYTDIWGHLKFGQWIAEHRALPASEPFTPFADPESAGVRQSWASQLLFYLIFSAGAALAGGDHLRELAGGAQALRLFLAILVVARGSALYFAFVRVSGSTRCAAAGLVLWIVASIGNIGVLRPQVLGELAFAVTLLALSRPLLSRPALIGLPIMFAVWANLHGSFLTGLVLLGAALLGRALVVIRTAPVSRWRATWSDGQCRRLALLMPLAILAIACLNPSGPAIYADALAVAAHPNVRAMDEWKPLSFHLATGWHLLYLLLVIALALTQLSSRRWFALDTLIFLALFGLPPLLHQRMMIWWVMIGPWLAVRYWPACRLPWSIPASTPTFRKTLLAGALVFMAACWSIPTQWYLAGEPGKLERILYAATPWQLAEALRDPAASTTPLAQYLRTHYPHGQLDGAIFASETLGDFLLWELPAGTPIFIYTHVHLFTPAHWRECAEIRAALPNWSAILDRHRINLVAVEPERNRDLCQLLREAKGWRVVEDDELFVAVRAR